MSGVEGQADRLKLTLAVLAASFISSAMSLIGPFRHFPRRSGMSGVEGQADITRTSSVGWN
jgi:hypothetical protein